MAVVNVGQAKNELSRLLARAEAGEEIEIARDGVPVVRLVRVVSEKPGEKFLRMWETGDSNSQFDETQFEFTEEELNELFYKNGLET